MPQQVDPFSIPMSAGVSEASAGPAANQMQWASGSAAGSLAGYSQAGAFPAVGGTTTSNDHPYYTSPSNSLPCTRGHDQQTEVKSPQTSHQGWRPDDHHSNHQRVVAKDCDRLEHLVPAGFNLLESGGAGSQATTCSLASPLKELRLSDFQRLDTRSPCKYQCLRQLVRAELLNSVLPDRVVTTAMQKGTLTVLDLLFITLQTYLPPSQVPG